MACRGENHKPSITVVDAAMGTGKSSWVFKTLNDSVSFLDTGERYLYAAPLLTECERIHNACPTLHFKQPIPIGGSKTNHLNSLILDNENIATTHQLLREISLETRDALELSHYTLIIDEEPVLVEEAVISTGDITVLFESEMVTVTSLNRLKWNSIKYPSYTGKFETIKKLCDNGKLVFVNDKLLIWELPIEILSLFKKVIVLTYLFEGSFMSCYLHGYDVDYEKKTLDENGNLVDGSYTEHEDLIKEQVRNMVTIVDSPSLNKIGEPKGNRRPLSSTWYKQASEADLKKLRNNLRNLFKNVHKTPSGKTLWTSFAFKKNSLKGKGYTKGFLSYNTKATNEYGDRESLAFCVDVYLRPRLKQYFTSIGKTPDEDLYALSILLQWVFRSRIRNGQPITIYIPSRRMRQLFKDWLKTENHGKQKELVRPRAFNATKHAA